MESRKDGMERSSTEDSMKKTPAVGEERTMVRKRATEEVVGETITTKDRRLRTKQLLKQQRSLKNFTLIQQRKRKKKRLSLQLRLKRKSITLLTPSSKLHNKRKLFRKKQEMQKSLRLIKRSKKENRK
jgi:hypothetical protein